RSETMITERPPSASVLSRRTLLVNGAAMATVAALPNRSAPQEGGTMSQASATQQGGMQAAEDKSIRPFRKFQVPQAALDDLRRRIAATQWPEKETVSDESQGVPLAMMQELARYWATDYDWRKAEAKLNAFPQFITRIDGLDIHFIHVRSK